MKDPESNLDPMVCLIWFVTSHTVNNILVMSGRVFLGWTSSTKQKIRVLLKDTAQFRRRDSNPQPPRSLVKHTTTEPLRSPNPDPMELGLEMARG